MTQETHFAKTPDGVYLAYQAVGSGAIDMVMDLHAFAGNVDLIWDEPDWGPLLTSRAKRSWLCSSTSPTSPRRRRSSENYSRRTVKRKRISKERLEEIHRQAYNRPNVRRLRELAEKAQAELDARKRESAAQE